MNPDQTTLNNFQAANPGLQPNAQDTAIMQGATPQSVGATPTINVSGLQTPTTPVNVPPMSPTTGYAGLKGAITASTDQFTQSLANQADTTKTASDSSLQALIASMTGSQSSAAMTSSAYSGTVDPAQKALTDANNQILAEKVATAHQVDSLRANPGGLSTEALNANINNIERASLSKQADLAVIQSAASGNYANAKAIADRAVQAQFENQQQKNDMLKYVYEQNKSLFTTAEQRQFEVAQKDRESNLALDQYKEKARYDEMIKQNDPQYQATLAETRAKTASLGGTSTVTPVVPQSIVLKAGDDPYNIAQQNGTDMATLQQLNPQVSDWHNLPVGTKLTLPSTGGGVPGTTGNSAINATANGYSTQAASGAGGLTQASIDQKALSYVMNGTLPPQGRTGIAGLQNAAISNRMAELDPNGTLAGNKADIKSKSESLAIQQKYLDTTQRAFNTANDTLASLQTFMSKNNINPSQFPDINSFTNYLKAKGIDPGAAGGYNAQIATLRAEYSQVLAKGGVRSVETDQQAAKLIPDGLAPKDLAKVAAQIQVDGTNVTNDAQKQVQQIQGQINGILQTHSSPADAPKTAPQPVLTPEQIPLGYYQASDGLLYKK